MARDTPTNALPNSTEKVDLTLYKSAYQSEKRKKAHAGTVKVEVFKERLRLRWSFGGHRYCISLGYPNSKVNRTVAEGLARRIEGDLPTGNFDRSLKKYKPESVLKLSRVSVKALFEKFIQEKSKSVYERSLEKYQTTLKYVDQYFQKRPAVEIDCFDAKRFQDCLSQELSPITVKERITCINACWKWAIKQGMVEKNPWQELVGRVKMLPKQKAKPFNREEIGAIIQAFRTDRYYNSFADGSMSPF
jgi:integrase